MFTNAHLERYAEVLLWGLQTARSGKIKPGEIFLVRYNIPAVKLAEKLAEITPGDLCRSLFCPGGSEAIEMAIMLARLVTGRFKTIIFSLGITHSMSSGKTPAKTLLQC